MISILCPSRGRPDKARKMMWSAMREAEEPVEVLFYANTDDEYLESYKCLAGMVITEDEEGNSVGPSRWVSVNHGPDQPTNKSWNELAKQAKGDLLMVCGDDVEFKTQGWDTKLKAAVPSDGWAILSVNDGRGGKDSHPHPIYTRKMYDALGYVMAPFWIHWWADTWAAELGKRLDRHYWVGEVLVEHQKDSDHGPGDLTHNRIRQGWIPSRDKFVWEHPATQRALDAEVSYVQSLITAEYR